MLLNQFERNIALTGVGRVNDSCHTASIALLPPGRFSHYAQDSRNATHSPPAAIKGYPPFGSWKIPLIFVLVSILALFYHKFTSTSIEIPCAATDCRDKNQHFHDILSNFIQQMLITVIQNWYVYA